MTPRTLVASPRATTRFRSAKQHEAAPPPARHEAPEPSVAVRPCALCRPATPGLWHGHGWQLSLGGPTGLPFTARLTPVRHLRQTELDGSLLESLEPILRTVKGVLTAEAEISDVEVMDSGPHAAHFQLMIMARPEHNGGGRLALLSEMLPEVNPALLQERGLRISAALPVVGDIAV